MFLLLSKEQKYSKEYSNYYANSIHFPAIQWQTYSNENYSYSTKNKNCINKMPVFKQIANS